MIAKSAAKSRLRQSKLQISRIVQLLGSPADVRIEDPPRSPSVVDMDVEVPAYLINDRPSSVNLEANSLQRTLTITAKALRPLPPNDRNVHFRQLSTQDGDRIARHGLPEPTSPETKQRVE